MRGQIQQIFLFLTAVLVIGASIFLGAKLIGGLSSTACEAGDVAFEREIKELLSANAMLGSTNEVAVSLPCDAIEVCFVDARALGNATFAGTDPTIRSAVRKNVTTNIFLKTRDGTIDRGYDSRIILERQTVQQSERCIEAVGGKFKFRTEGYGRYVKITGLS